MPFLLKGVVVTLELTFFSLIIGTVGGIVLGLMKSSGNPVIRWPARIFIECFMAIPVLVLLIWVYYCLPLIIPIKLSNFATAVLSFSLSLAAFIGEIIAGGIQSIPRGQIAAALALGLRYKHIVRHIILPQLLQLTISPILTQYVTLLKLSSLASVISVYEILHRGQTLISQTYRPLEIYTIVAGLYIALVLGMIYLTRILESKIKWRY